MNFLTRWTRRFAEGEYDGLMAASLFGLIMGGLVAISIIMEAQ